jgi:hypothetical protein
METGAEKRLNFMEARAALCEPLKIAKVFTAEKRKNFASQAQVVNPK